MSDVKYIIEGDLYLDSDAKLRIPTPIGFFDERDDADAFMWKMRPFFGTWDVVAVHTPEQVAKNVDRADAANFLLAKIRMDNLGIQARADKVIETLLEVIHMGDQAQADLIIDKVLNAMAKEDRREE